LRVIAVLVLACSVGTSAASSADGAEGEPTSSSPPSISGTARDGQRLQVAKGAWNGNKPLSFVYVWSLCDSAGDACTAIPLADKSSYKLIHEDVGGTLRATVHASNSAGESSATTQQTDVVAPAAPGKGKRPKIAGTAKDGQLLTVSNGTWKGTPPESFMYQWQACPSHGPCANIPTATGASYRATTAQIGEKLRAVVTATNSVGQASATSSSSKRVGAGPPVDLAVPVISGNLQEGQKLNASPGEWAGTAPIGFTYQWLRCSITGGSCQEITGATASTYTAGIEDLASDLAVVVTASNAQGSATATSGETQTILGILPTNTALPTIGGVLQDGSLLSASTGTWSGSEPISYAYQWQLCNALGKACEDIEGATGSTLKLNPSEIGKTLALVVTATNAAGPVSATSTVTGLIEGILPKNTALPTIGGLLKNGQLLSVTNGSWTGSEPIAYAYQWQLCNALGGGCANVAKATSSTFLLGALDIGGTLRAVVTATNAAGSASATSALSGLIAGL
jgi:hypothetical protein